MPDLFDEQAGLVVEFDGAEHRGIGRHARDVRRQEACRDAGLEYCVVIGPDLHDRQTLEYPPGYLPWFRFPTNPRF